MGQWLVSWENNGRKKVNPTFTFVRPGVDKVADNEEGTAPAEPGKTIGGLTTSIFVL